MLKATAWAVSFFLGISALLMFIDILSKKVLKSILSSVPNDGSLDPNTKTALSANEATALRRWGRGRLVLWGLIILVTGFLAGLYPKEVLLTKLWFVAPLLLFAIINDLFRRCPRCRFLMVRQTLVFLPRRCLKCGVSYF